MSKFLSILSIEPDDETARRLEVCLAQLSTYQCGFHRQHDPGVALRRLARYEADVLFIANAMPAVTGREVILAARDAGEVRPIIATSEEDCGYLAADLMAAGADAYLLTRDLGPAMLQSVLRRSLVSARQRAAQVKLRRDALSGMLNRPRKMTRSY